MNFAEAEKFAFELLKTKLSKDLHYHDFQHTVDVMEVAVKIAGEEGIHDPQQIMILRTAALYHDVGFSVRYDGHEEEGCVIARRKLPEFGYSPADIETICGLIMATKVPQSPKTLLEKVLCDSDLDYLGRDDFFSTGNRLFMEWKAIGKISDLKHWNELQMKFLKTHTYWTESSRRNRRPKKLENVTILEESDSKTH